MISRLKIPVSIAVVVVILRPSAFAGGGDDLPSGLRALEASGARVGALVVRGNRVLLRHRSSTRFNPASVSKLFTAALAYRHLAGRWRFSTRVCLLPRSVVCVRGSADPTLRYKHLRGVAKKVVQSITPRMRRRLKIWVDPGPFTVGSLPPGYGQKRTDAAYRAGVAGFQVDFSSVAIVVEARRKSGGRPRVKVVPFGPHIGILNSARTCRRCRNSLEVSILPGRRGRFMVSIRGRIRRGRHVAVRRRVPHPLNHAVYVFAGLLEREGARVVDVGVHRCETGKPRRCYRLPHSPGLFELLSVMLKESQNQIAETLFRLAGYAASHMSKPVGFLAAQRAMREFLTQEVGLSPRAFTIRNGSGLYCTNEVTPEAAVALIEFLERNTHMRAVLRALPLAGKEGTLRHRFRGTPLYGRLRAKTGTLDDVVSLAGYVPLPKGQSIVFFLAVNQPHLDKGAAQKAIDSALVEVVVPYLRHPRSGGR